MPARMHMVALKRMNKLCLKVLTKKAEYTQQMGINFSPQQIQMVTPFCSVMRHVFLVDFL